MKRYRSFMDGVRVSGTLHQRLRELEKPGKRPVPWAKYGTVAAALLLVCGLGGYGAWAAHVNSRSAPLPSYPPGWQGVPEIGAVGAPDIATAEPGGPAEPAPHILAGSYEVTRDGVTTHYLLPYIEYGEEEGVETPMDWDVPPGSVKRDLTGEEIAALMGGEDVLSDHLAWGEEYALSGWAAWYGDGSFWGAYINGLMPNYGGAVRKFEFAVTSGQLPPTCIVYPNSAEQNISGVMVTAGKYDWEESFGPSTYPVHERRVSFLTDGYGYRFEMSSGDPDLTEELVSRLVRQVIDSGVAPDRLSSGGEGSIPGVVPNYDPAYEDGASGQDGSPRDRGENWCGAQGADTETCPDCGVTYPAGEAHYHTQTCEICGRNYPVGSAHGHPFMGGDTETCPDCGASYPAGTAHDCAMCGGDPLPHICEICGEAYPEGAAHSHEVCGYPLAPDTHVCEVCGQAIPVGMEHSHQEGHHQDHH